MKKIIKIISISLLLLFLNFLNFVNANEKIKIGLLVPMTGENKDLGSSIIKAVSLAVKDINNDLIEIDELSKRFSEIYIYTYTDLHPLCDTIQSCPDQENKFVESKSGCMELLLKRDYYNRSFQNILQFIERQFLCKIRDNMRKNTNRML